MTKIASHDIGSSPNTKTSIYTRETALRSQSFSSFSSVLVWTSENDTIKEIFDNALVWTGPRGRGLIQNESDDNWNLCF